ncbi:MAG: hypothetical protein ABIL58_05935 [Pseudomonadota bacterium]
MRPGAVHPIRRNLLRNTFNAFCFGTAVAVGVFAVVPMVCAEKGVTEEILGILKENDQISRRLLETNSGATVYEMVLMTAGSSCNK